MQDNELYRQLLGVEYPWTVNCVSLNIEEIAVYIYLVEAPDATWCCPTCGEPATLYDHREERIWRHLLLSGDNVR